MLLSIVVIGIAQHGLFILAHEAAHYRLFANRARQRRRRAASSAWSAAISMCTYRVTHRLHHNNLYTEEDPDTAIHGGYPRGKAYLLQEAGCSDLARPERLEDLRLFLRRAGDQRRHEARDPAAGRHLAASCAPRRARDRLVGRGFHARRAAGRRSRPAAGAGCAMYAVLWLLPLVTVLQPILRLRAICEHGAVARPELAADRGAHQPHLGLDRQLAGPRGAVPAPRQLPPGAPPLPRGAALPPAARCTGCWWTRARCRRPRCAMSRLPGAWCSRTGGPVPDDRHPRSLQPARAAGRTTTCSTATGAARCAAVQRAASWTLAPLAALGRRSGSGADADARAAGQRPHAAAAHARPLRPPHRRGRVPSQLPRADGGGGRGRPARHALGRRAHRPHVQRAAGFMLFTELEPSVLCPISMTYAVTPALRGNAGRLRRLGSQARQPRLRPARSSPGATSPA